MCGGEGRRDRLTYTERERGEGGGERERSTDIQTAIERRVWGGGGGGVGETK